MQLVIDVASPILFPKQALGPKCSQRIAGPSESLLGVPDPLALRSTVRPLPQIQTGGDFPGWWCNKEIALSFWDGVCGLSSRWTRAPLIPTVPQLCELPFPSLMLWTGYPCRRQTPHSQGTKMAREAAGVGSPFPPSLLCFLCAPCNSYTSQGLSSPLLCS